MQGPPLLGPVRVLVGGMRTLESVLRFLSEFFVARLVSGSGSHTGCAGGAGVAGAGKVGAHGLPDAVLCSACPSKGAARGPTCWPRRSLGLEHHLTEKQVGEAAQSQAAQCACPEMPQPGGPDPGEQRVMAHSDSACIFYASIQVFLCACSVPGQRAQSE